MIEEIIKGKVTWYKIINYLGKLREPICSKKIRREITSNQSFVSVMLNNLENKNIVEYLLLKEKTKKYWRLTTRGKKIYNLLLKLEELMR